MLNEAPDTTVLKFGPDVMTHHSIGAKKTVVVVSKKDLADPISTQLIDRLLKKVFKG